MLLKICLSNHHHPLELSVTHNFNPVHLVSENEPVSCQSIRAIDPTRKLERLAKMKKKKTSKN